MQRKTTEIYGVSKWCLLVCNLKVVVSKIFNSWFNICLATQHLIIIKIKWFDAYKNIATYAAIYTRQSLHYKMKRLGRLPKDGSFRFKSAGGGVIWFGNFSVFFKRLYFKWSKINKPALTEKIFRFKSHYLHLYSHIRCICRICQDHCLYCINMRGC